LFCFIEFGALERALPREGDVHSACDWHSVLKPVVARFRDEDIRSFFRGDAVFGNPDTYTSSCHDFVDNHVRLQLFGLA
jgi:hypothetical protein